MVAKVVNQPWFTFDSQSRLRMRCVGAILSFTLMVVSVDYPSVGSAQTLFNGRTGMRKEGCNSACERLIVQIQWLFSYKKVSR